MLNPHRVRRMMGLLIAALVLVMGACTSDGNGEPDTEEPTSGVVEQVVASLPKAEVTLAWIPVWDDTPWLIAQDLGYFEQAGITIDEVRSFAFVQPAVEALANGEVDLGGSNHFGAPPFLKTLDNLRYVGVSDMWGGFAFLAREGSGLRTFDEFMAENGGNPEEAIASVVEQFEGLTIVTTVGGDFDPILSLAFGHAGKEIGDFEYIDIPGPEGATAFIRGEGDLFSGDIPSRFRVEEEGAYPVLTGANLGPDASQAIGHLVREDMPDDIVLKLLGVYYRAIDLIASDPDQALGIMAEHLNEETGSEFDVAFGEWIATEISPWLTFEEAGPIYFESSGAFYFNRMFQDVIDYWVEEGSIEAGEVTVEGFSRAEELYQELVELKELTEQQLADVEASGDSSAEVAQLVELAQEAQNQRNYVDSAILSSAAAEEAGL